MDPEAIFREVQKLPLEQKRVLLAAIEDAVRMESGKDQLTADQIAELERSYDAYLKSPEKTSSWEEVRARIERKLKAAG